MFPCGNSDLPIELGVGEVVLGCRNERRLSWLVDDGDGEHLLQRLPDLTLPVEHRVVAGGQAVARHRGGDPHRGGRNPGARGTCTCNTTSQDPFLVD